MVGLLGVFLRLYGGWGSSIVGGCLCCMCGASSLFISGKFFNTPKTTSIQTNELQNIRNTESYTNYNSYMVTRELKLTQLAPTQYSGNNARGHPNSQKDEETIKLYYTLWVGSLGRHFDAQCTKTYEHYESNYKFDTRRKIETYLRNVKVKKK